jgi:hypothetical protein
MGFQIGTISHTKVIRLDRNTLLGRGMGMDMVVGNMCIFSNVHNVSTYYNSGDATTWHLNQIHLPIFNIQHIHS